MNKKRELKTLKGFSDVLPEEMKLKQYVIGTFRSVFEKYGYEPLETPALEYASTLLGISGEEAEKLFYRFTDNGDRDVVMRYEVMVPMCRVIAQYRNEITFPFKRYQIQSVWRAENVQKGRLREFTQCDADTIGTPSMIADAEFIQMGIEILQRFGFTDFYAQISNRKLLDGILAFYGLPESQFYGVCMAIDKIRKIGPDGVKKELTEKQQLTPEIADKLLQNLQSPLENEALITRYQTEFKESNLVQEALTEITQIFDYLKTSRVNPRFYRFDPTIARGLAHYTGPVWEFEIKEGNVGSVAGCGRYDKVINTYLGTDEIIPATGGSFGIERMMIVLKERGLAPQFTNTAQILVTIFDQSLQKDSIEIADTLRKNGISTLLYPNENSKLDKQIKYASRKNIPIVVIEGPEEKNQNQVIVKDMTKKTQQSINRNELIAYLKTNLLNK